MKKIALFFLFLGLLSQAATDPFIFSVDKELNDVFGESVSGGETTAEVLKKNGEPQIKCSKIIFNKGRKIVFCTAEIQTTYGENKGNHGGTTCTSLGYILDKKGNIDTRYYPDMFQKCMEKVYDSSYD
jgi:hypothetical protein